MFESLKRLRENKHRYTSFFLIFYEQNLESLLIFFKLNKNIVYF
jgi:hypothetical protein